MKRPEFKDLLGGEPGIESYYKCYIWNDFGNFIKSTAHIPGDTTLESRDGMLPSCTTLAALRLFYEQYSMVYDPVYKLYPPVLLYALEVLPMPANPTKIGKVGKCVKLLAEKVHDEKGTDRKDGVSQSEQ